MNINLNNQLEGLSRCDDISLCADLIFTLHEVLLQSCELTNLHPQDQECDDRVLTRAAGYSFGPSHYLFNRSSCASTL